MDVVQELVVVDAPADAEVELPKAPVMDPFADDPVDLENKVVALLKP